MKIIIVLAFVAILVSLGSALVFMMREGRGGRPRTNRMVRALAWRVGISIALFLFILLGYKLGWIQPGGVPVAR